MRLRKSSLWLKFTAIFAAAVFSFAFAFKTASFAQDKNQNAQPKLSPDEAKAAKKIQDAKNLPEREKAITEFIQKYPKSQLRPRIAKYAAEQIAAGTDDNQKVELSTKYLAIFTQPEEVDLISPSLIDSYVKLKRYDDAFKLAGDYLSRHPEDVGVRLQLAVEGSNLNRTGNPKFADQSRDFAAKAIELIEANKRPADISEEVWKNNQSKWLPLLYQTLGFFNLSSGNRAEAQSNLEKASTLNPNDPNNWVLLGSLLDEDYRKTATLYQAATGKEREELLKKATQQLDKIIDYYARIVALTDNNPNAQALNKQVREDLESYYKYRNKNSTAGMQELINKYKVPKNQQ